MKLVKARVTNYRSIKDTGWFDIENKKTIMVGPNEAGKTAVLRALQQINAPADTQPFDPLRDYPRSQYNDITTKKIDPARTTVATAHFALQDSDKVLIDEEFRTLTYTVGRKLDNKAWHQFCRIHQVSPMLRLKKTLPVSSLISTTEHQSLQMRLTPRHRQVQYW